MSSDRTFSTPRQAAGRYRTLLTLLLTVILTGCGSDADRRASLDAQIEGAWLDGRQLTDALPFLEQGGVYVDSEEAEEGDIDQSTVLPLVRQLQEELDITAQVVLESPGDAVALLVPLPEDTSLHSRIREMLNTADEEFSGLVMHNWGNRWISLDFFDRNDLRPLTETGVLDAIRQHQQEQ